MQGGGLEKMARVKRGGHGYQIGINAFEIFFSFFFLFSFFYCIFT